MFTQTILADCGIPMESDQVAIPMESEQVAVASPRTSGHVAQSLRELKVAEEKLKDQLVQQQLANNARVDRVLDMLASASTMPGQPSH